MDLSEVANIKSLFMSPLASNNLKCNASSKRNIKLLQMSNIAIIADMWQADRG